MIKERIKSSVILILIINMVFLTFQLWFTGSAQPLKNDIVRYIRSLPIVETFFPTEPQYSISKENLSKPRKFLINDGSLWMAYYNTDIGFDPIDQRTREIVKGFLRGDVTASKKIDYEMWESGLDSLGIYVEYPVSFPTETFCRIMGTDATSVPSEIKTLRDLIIIPSGSDTDVCILVRDCVNTDLIYAYIMDDNYSLPAEDLSVYTNNNTDGYYEPAFSAGLLLGSENTVSLSPLVLFSDSQPMNEVLRPSSLINDVTGKALLENFSFNPLSITPYEDTSGALNYISNYASFTIYPDSVFEYNVIEDDKGIDLGESIDAYNVLNASIDFAEKAWKCASPEPLSILVTSDLSDYTSDKAFTFKFDYYCNGRPVEVDVPERYGHGKMNSAIEITVKNGKLISYRQHLRSYKAESFLGLSDSFVTALDGFVNTLGKSESPVTIEDIYIGYLDCGLDTQISAAWLAKTSDGKIHRHEPQTEVSNSELE